MGRNHKWVLEDSIQDAVWKTLLRGPRPPSVRWEKERNQSTVANPKKELKWKDTGATRQGNARSPKVVPSQPQRSVRQSPPEVYAAAHGRGRDWLPQRTRLSKHWHRGKSVSRSYRHSRGALLQVQWQTPRPNWFVSERKWQNCKGPRESNDHVVKVSPAEMPCLIPAELSAWMADRQKDMQEALNTDHSRVIELSSMLTVGAERVVEMTRPEISDDEFRSRTAPGEGRFAPY